jgi:hypothetical protein
MTVATVIDLVAAFVLPVIVIAAGHSDWVLPSWRAKPTSPSTARNTWPDRARRSSCRPACRILRATPGPAEIEGIIELRPALHAKELHEAFAGLVADGKTTPRVAPRNPLQLGATFWHFRHESRVTSPPILAQNLPRYLRWPGSSASAPATTAGTAGPEQPAQATRNYPATDRRRCPRPGLPALRSPPIATAAGRHRSQGVRGVGLLPGVPGRARRDVGVGLGGVGVDCR